MFDRHDRLYLTGSDPPKVVEPIQRFLAAGGYHLRQIGPATWLGNGPIDSFATPQIRITCTPGGDAQWVEVHQSVTLEGTNLIVAVVVCVVFWPAAAILAFLTYQSAQARQPAISHGVANAVTHLLGEPPGGGPGYWPGGPPGVTVPR